MTTPKTDAAMTQSTYTCADYRREQILLALTRRLEDADIAEAEKELLRRQIKKLETDLGMA